jgi:LuxR family transcriptional regulator, quorum-sensing system regulator BjaR1
MIEFISASNSLHSEKELSSLFCEVLNERHYVPFVCYTKEGVMPALSELSGEKLAQVQKFLSMYHSQRFHETDAIMKLYPRAKRPFDWEEVEQLPLSAPQKAAMQLRRAAGWVKGICIPTKNFSPELVGMTVVSKDPAPVNKTQIGEINAIVNHYLLRRAALRGEDKLTLPEVELSPREKEILIACSLGKTNILIGKALGITERTVEFHLASVFKKLKVNNRTMAVVKAVNNNLIHI